MKINKDLILMNKYAQNARHVFELIYWEGFLDFLFELSKYSYIEYFCNRLDIYSSIKLNR